MGTNINSQSQFLEIKDFFTKAFKLGIYTDIPVKEPYYIGEGSGGYKLKWFADKWYKCNKCGCLWEFIYPDFPAEGVVKKHEDGKHQLE